MEFLKKWFLKRKTKKIKFPCSDKNCLVRASCTKGCDKLMYDKKELNDFFLKYGLCPDCGSEKFFEGPAGGMSQNIKCAECEHYFNVAFPVFAERINIDSKQTFIKSW